VVMICLTASWLRVRDSRDPVFDPAVLRSGPRSTRRPAPRLSASAHVGALRTQNFGRGDNGPITAVSGGIGVTSVARTIACRRCATPAPRPRASVGRYQLSLLYGLELDMRDPPGAMSIAPRRTYVLDAVPGSPAADCHAADDEGTVGIEGAHLVADVERFSLAHGEAPRGAFDSAPCKNSASRQAPRPESRPASAKGMWTRNGGRGQAPRSSHPRPCMGCLPAVGHRPTLGPSPRERGGHER
jgi:hypothetical protein